MVLCDQLQSKYEKISLHLLNNILTYTTANASPIQLAVKTVNQRSAEHDSQPAYDSVIPRTFRKLVFYKASTQLLNSCQQHKQHINKCISTKHYSVTKK